MVQEMRESLAASGTVYLAVFEGLSVSHATELRGHVLEAGGRMQMVKNRLLKIAVKGTPYEVLTDELTGPNTVIYCGDDPIAPLKVVAKFAADHNLPPVKAGVVEGALVSASELEELAKVPGRTELLAGVVGAFAGPVNELVFTLGGVVSDLVFTLQSVAEQKGEAEAA
ncbi:MAG TPA: 50S ribosomal protein L10 [Armatimonadetes bacterium]|nr:50S ribosomal protein L10 [Armatimonadota bacterium]